VLCVKLSTTTVLVLARWALRPLRVEGILRWAVLAWLTCGLTAVAQQRPVHWLNAGAMPPGAIGSLRLERGGPLSGYFQPVRIRAPEGARIALAMEGSFQALESNEALAGMLIGSVYRFRVSDILNHPGLEIYPTIEVIDRTYPPPGLALRFPIPIELTQDELELAAGSAFVTRVIYLEDPSLALPVQQHLDQEQPWMEAPPGEDPLVVADRLGRPVAILRIGGRVPNAADTENGCAPGSSPLMIYDATATTPRCCPDIDDGADENVNARRSKGISK
jgi:hypothetical protein